MFTKENKVNSERAPWNKGTIGLVKPNSGSFKPGIVPWSKGRVGLGAGEANPFFGKTHSPEAREKMSLAKRGKKLGAEHRRKMSEAGKGKIMTQQWRDNIGLGKKGQMHSLEARKRMSDAKKGNKSSLWKGGITPINAAIRQSFEYKNWRKAVFERDNYTCIWCGKNGNLNADHIKPFAHFPYLRFSLENGRTLCVPCHKKTDTFGNKAKIKK